MLTAKIRIKFELKFCFCLQQNKETGSQNFDRFDAHESNIFFLPLPAFIFF